MKQITQEEIAKYIAEKINYEVQNLVQNIKSDNEKFETLYKRIIDELEYQLEESTQNIEAFEESKLTINKIEQEGYRRCLHEVINLFRAIKNDIIEE
jgi:hypothetical protein